ncbi:capsular polysaccharide biosynthesis protein [Sinorhizobium meliloti]|uniref:capsular polysaccharide export protein, LipB/KpsS family n=1 Tax=Rhizobium meliloti TaxID=382 RepID=UPI001295A00D|nr:capsular polysaccharide biosynthesis protein [Sinorhizobium meliloti]MQX22944.1 capsular polysaccharide biosynthesis protein [Sinorhizobium meliloti]
MVQASTIAVEAAKTPFRVAGGIASRYLPKRGKPPLYLFGFNEWKTFVHDWFPERKVIFAPMNLWPVEFEINWKWRILSDPRAEVLAWQYKGPPKLKAFCQRYGVPFHYVEDGFIRSISLGALHTPPLSLVFDKQDMYFNSNAASDLETILKSYDFETDVTLADRAQSVMDKLQATKLSKYNSSDFVDIEAIYGPKDRKRVLVIGQVERDASIAYGCSKRYSNNDLVWLAKRENPDAQVIYKPHPEVLQGTAEAVSDPDLVRGAALVIDQDVTLPDAMQTIDHVYTITSLAGFEALMRSIKVTTLGCPFYSGWGLTDDRQPNKRRGRKLTVAQLFAAAYILYPRYFDPITKKFIEIEDAIELLAWMRTHQPAQKAASKIEQRSNDTLRLLAEALAPEILRIVKS